MLILSIFSMSVSWRFYFHGFWVTNRDFWVFMERCSGNTLQNIDLAAINLLFSHRCSLFQLDGSLIILAENVIGSTINDERGEPILQYGRRYHFGSVLWTLQTNDYENTSKISSIHTGVQGVNYRMSGYWMMELIGIQEIIYIGSMMCSDLRH